MKCLSLPTSLIAFQVSLFFGVDTAWGASSDTHSSTITSHASSSSGNATATSSSISANSANVTLTNTAQFPSLTGVPPCATSCFETAISDANCTSVIDINCFCVSGKFPKGIVSCISKTCPTLLNSTEELAQQFCNVSPNSTSLSFPAPTTTSTATSGTAIATVPVASSTNVSTSVSTTASATQSGGAVALGWGVGGESGRMVLVGLGVGVMGLVGGALCI